MGFLGEGTCRLSRAAAVGAEAAITSESFDGDGVMTTTWPVSLENGGFDDVGMFCCCVCCCFLLSGAASLLCDEKRFHPACAAITAIRTLVSTSRGVRVGLESIQVWERDQMQDERGQAYIR